LYKSAIDHAKSDGMKIVTVPDKLKNSLSGLCDLEGNPVRDLGVYQSEWEQSFEFKFVKPEQLTKAEAKIFALRTKIAGLVGGLPKAVRQVKISETMRPDFLNGSMTTGLWESASGSIIILRSQLKSLRSFAGTLLHELAHARSGHDDVTRAFESELTDMLGRV